MKTYQIIRIITLATCTFACAAVVHAGNISSVTWVSGTGSDSNFCSRTAPCRTWARAMSFTDSGGEIVALDPGDFGAVMITKSITLHGTGTLASIHGSLDPVPASVTVNAGADDTVILRDLSLSGLFGPTNGIRYIAGGTLVVDHCSISGFKDNTNSRGIDVALTNNGNLKVLDTVIEDIREDGIRMTTTSGQLVVTIDNTRIMNCGQDGIEAVSNVRAAIRNSVITHNRGVGVKTSGSNSLLNIDDIFVSYSSIGLRASAGSQLRVSDSVIAQNSTGLSANGGTIASFQGNSLMGNPTPGAFTTTTPKQ